MAMIADVFVSKLCETLLTYAKEEAIKILGVSDEIKKLHRRLKRMQAVLADAENRRFDNEAIKLWLNELRDLMYDADDMIDECWIEGEKFLSSNSSSSRYTESVNCCYPPIACLHKVGFRHEIGNRIRDLILKLDELAKDKTDLHLTSAPRNDRYKSKISPKTSPVLVEPDLVGEKIEDDTRRLVHLLTKENKKKIPIFAIVGMGGIGKTTLAQKIYNDEKLRDKFNQMPRIWLCVSQDFSESVLLRSIIKQAGGNPGDNEEKEVLEPMLSELLRNKKFFLVLDDVWDAQVWDKLLRNPLHSGLVDSRILITTRNINIAQQMGAIHTHMVDKLSRDDGWSLICKMVFEEGEEGERGVLRDVGMRIVEKCDGLPLALRTIGGVLRTKATRQSEWEKVLSSSAWSFTKLPDGVMGALYLSYLHLPPPLKQCFTFLSLFPEDHLITQGSFINSCIAGGLVIFEDNTPSEDVAEGYWKELVQRNLLQPDPKYYDQSVCRMHDLLRSLAQHIAGNECFVGDAQAFDHKIMSSSSSSSSIKLRHLSIVDEKLEIIPDFIMEQISLRNLSFFHTPLIRDLPEDLFKMLRSLRVLNLSETAISNLPTFLGDLIHLRLLDLSATSIREIPDSIRNLRNLQFLFLDGCKYLHNLPNGVVGLINLRGLDVRDAPLDGLPVGIGSLKQLRSLGGFVVSGSEGCKSGVGEGDREQEHKGHQHGRFCTLEELKSLSQLQGLTIENLERVSNRAEAKAAALQAKPHLIRLDLYCKQLSSSSDVQQPRASNYDEEDIKRIREVFEELCPPPCIEILSIHDYFGREFPSWMMTRSSSSLPRLRWLELSSCALCQQLPLLGMLPQLDYLWIEGVSAVTSIGPEFFSSSYFPRLEKLIFEDMPKLEEWWWEEDNRTTSLLPSLKEISIIGCPKLNSLPESLLCHAAALQELYMTGAHSLREIQNLPSLTKLILEHNSSLERVSNFPRLKQLIVVDCEKLKVVEGVDAVEHIELNDREVESLPEWLAGAGEEQPRFPSLHKLTLKNKIGRRGLPDWPLI
ncbi:putative disease resistance protein RGA3 [Phoenix dactylifera]|uniref:Disease resistance protein RGA3 n=1 Tax=Phoenix dactylifera TaxID=42345 RepID=A0A8B8ZGM5_PHODC|nr:putative disease resistance protein RGA3 [Phoenix dactylifera]